MANEIVFNWWSPLETRMANVTWELETTPLNVPYAVCEIIVAIVAVVGNALVLCVFQRERKLRRRTNYYIVSLAAADLLVGLLGMIFISLL